MEVPLPRVSESNFRLVLGLFEMHRKCTTTRNVPLHEMYPECTLDVLECTTIIPNDVSRPIQRVKEKLLCGGMVAPTHYIVMRRGLQMIMMMMMVEEFEEGAQAAL